LPFKAGDRPMRMQLAGFAALVCAAASLDAQNLLSNGDFENGLAPWTASGGGTLAGIQNFNTSGTGSSMAYGVHPDSKGPHVIKQRILLINGVTYELSMDLAENAPNTNAQGVAFEVWMGGQKVTEWTRGAGSSIGGSLYRERLCGRITLSGVNTGQNDVEIRFVRPRFTSNSGTPRGHADNIDLRFARDPVICTTGERKLGGSLNLELMGPARAQIGLFIALSNGPPFPIPGFSGQVELGVPMRLLLTGPLDTSGRWKIPIPIPNDPTLDGVAV